MKTRLKNNRNQTQSHKGTKLKNRYLIILGVLVPLRLRSGQAWWQERNGSVLIVVIFVIALLSAVTIGILQMNTEEIQLMQNQIYAAQALATAEAGLNDAFGRIRDDSSSIDDFPFTSVFNGGSYTVLAVEGSLPDPNIISEGTSLQGFTASVKADVTIGTGSPYVIRIDNLRINE